MSTLRGSGVWLPLVLFVVAVASSCCTEEIGQAVGEAARDSMYAEQDRIQQRFIQAESDSLAASKRMLETVTTQLLDNSAAQMTKFSTSTASAFEEFITRASKQISESFSDNMLKTTAEMGKRFSDNMVESSERLSAGFRENMKKTSDEVAATFTDAIVKVNDTTTKNLEKLVETTEKAITETRERVFHGLGSDLEKLRIKTLEEVETTAQQARDKTLQYVSETRQKLEDRKEADAIREQIQPIITQIIKESTQQLGQELKAAGDGLAAGVAVPLATAGIVAAFVTFAVMVLPTILLFMSYRRSTKAITALRDMLAAQAAVLGPLPPELEKMMGGKRVVERALRLAPTKPPSTATPRVEESSQPEEPQT